MLPLTVDKGAEGGFKAQNCSYLMQDGNADEASSLTYSVWTAIGTAAFTLNLSLLAR